MRKDKDVRRDVPRLLVAFVSGATVTAIGLLLLVTIPTVVGRLARPKIYEVTSPLEASVVHDLCSKLGVPASDPPCQPGTVVYAPDFFSAVKAEFRPGIATYTEVQEKLGVYQVERRPLVTQADGAVYFESSYDFKGDGVFPVVFFFTEDGELWRLFATTGDD